MEYEEPLMEHKAFVKLMVFMVAITTIAVCLFGTPSFAGTATLTWTPPTENVCVAPCVPPSPYTNYGGFKVYYGLRGSTLFTVIDLPDTTNKLNTYVVNNLGAGTWDFYVTAYNSSKIESEKAGPASKVIMDNSTPVPPGMTFSTTATAVYNLVKKTNGFVLVYVGTIPLNTPCDITQSVNGYYAVPVSAVSWSGTVKPIVVVAQCSTH
jgi:hypothetical protein